MNDTATPYGHSSTQVEAPRDGTPSPVGRTHVGKVRSTGLCILLMIVTFGIYAWVWYYRVHDDMKRHTGKGIGGLAALLVSMYVGFLLPVMPYITAEEVGKLHERAGRPAPVTGLTGLWFFPGMFLLGVGPIVWFVKTNGALNEYWRLQGAEG